jgi:hypothetical protein
MARHLHPAVVDAADVAAAVHAGPVLVAAEAREQFLRHLETPLSPLMQRAAELQLEAAVLRRHAAPVTGRVMPRILQEFSLWSGNGCWPSMLEQGNPIRLSAWKASSIPE